MNASAFRLIYETRPKGQNDVFVEFMFDADNKVVGMRAVSPGVSGNAYQVRKQPSSESYLISGRGFLKYYNIPIDSVRRYKARILNNEKFVGFSLISDEIKQEVQNEAASE